MSWTQRPAGAPSRGSRSAASFRASSSAAGRRTASCAVTFSDRRDRPAGNSGSRWQQYNVGTAADRNLVRHGGHVSGALLLELGSNKQRPGQPIGTDATGRDSANGWPPGRFIATIGGPRPGQRHLGNAYGTWIQGTPRQGNLIGLPTAFPRQCHEASPSTKQRLEIGGIGPGEGNSSHTMALGGCRRGAFAHAVRGNSIHDNGALGINLDAGIFPRPTTPATSTTGQNNLQNFPILIGDAHGRLHARRRPSSTRRPRRRSTSTSTPTRRAQLPARVRRGPDVSRHRARHDRRLGPRRDRRDSSGGDRGRRPVTATATDPSGNTSEFSQRLVFAMTSFVLGTGRRRHAHQPDRHGLRRPDHDDHRRRFGSPVTFGDYHTLQATSPAL